MITRGIETRQGQDLQGLGAKHESPSGNAGAPYFVAQSARAERES